MWQVKDKRETKENYLNNSLYLSLWYYRNNSQFCIIHTYLIMITITVISFNK